ncbi:MAG: hypothetical protein KIS85_09330 [Anaerolineales bacterium]|nr:hypothetical protein [Anaerolineales bacterium]
MTSLYVLGIASDLFFVPRIEAAVTSAGLATRWISQPEPADAFLPRLKGDPPSLIVLDLAAQLPWAEWLPAAKADPLTRHITWLAFGPHDQPALLAAAREAGADKVVAKAAFAAELHKALGRTVQALD